jgi:formate dehydrogenase subunit gamma
MNDRQELVRTVAEQRRADRGALMPVLHEVHEELGHVTREDMVTIADVLNLSVAEVHGVVSFYSDFRTEPPPPHRVALCRAEACQAVGAQALWDDVAGAGLGDGVEVTQVFCLGNCALGPSGTVDGRLHGRLDGRRLRELTAGWRA